MCAFVFGTRSLGTSCYESLVTKCIQTRATLSPKMSDNFHPLPLMVGDAIQYIARQPTECIKWEKPYFKTVNVISLHTVSFYYQSENKLFCFFFQKLQNLNRNGPRTFFVITITPNCYGLGALKCCTFYHYLSPSHCHCHSLVRS